MGFQSDYLGGKTALITGAARRIGRAIAYALAENEINIIVHYDASNVEDVEEVVLHIQNLGVKSWMFRADFSVIDETIALFERVKDTVGQVDFLVNNASIFVPSNLRTLTTRDLEHTLSINSIAPLLLSQQFAKQTKEGCIVNMLDSRIKGHDLNYAAYQLSKNMLFHLTELIAMEFAPDIRANGIAPGLILPPDGKDDTYLQMQCHRNLLHRSGNLKNITDTVLFLLSNTFITGEVLFVDGGEKLMGVSYKGGPNAL